MSTTFWVSLSTIVFLIIVVVKGYRSVLTYLSKQQEEIKRRLTDADDIYQKAYNLYEEYRNRIEALEIEGEQILQNARDESQKIINSIDDAVSKAISKKNKELLRIVEDYKLKATNDILIKYADIIAEDLYLKASYVDSKES